MKGLHELLQYRNCYRYSKRCEHLHFIPAENEEQAIELYSRIIQNCAFTGTEQWALEIALDCIREMTVEDLVYIAEHKDIEEYHLNYGLYVRNTYIHPSRFHFYSCPDKMSTLVKQFIIGIICPEHNPFKEEK